MFQTKLFQDAEPFIKTQAVDGRVQHPDYRDAQRIGEGRCLRLTAAQRLQMMVAQVHTQS